MRWRDSLKFRYRRRLQAELLEPRLLLAYDLTNSLFPDVTGPQPFGQFGSAVAASEDYRVVGEIRVDDGELQDVGAVSVFDADNQLLAYLANPTPQPLDLFGSAVDVSGDIIVVGAPNYGGTAITVGRAFVYQLVDGVANHWLTLDNPAPTDDGRFGRSVAVDGDILVVGAIEDDSGIDDAGVAYVYDLASADLTTPGLTLKHPDPGPFDRFGFEVDIADNVIAVSATGDDTGDASAGSVFVFDLSSDTPLVPVQTVNNPTPGISDLFGSSVALSGNTLVASAPFDDTTGFNTGSAYVYDLAAANPTVPVHTLLNPTPSDADWFGSSLAVSGDTVIVGAYSDDTGAVDAGSAYVFDLTSGTPEVPVETLHNPTPDDKDDFGVAVAVTGGVVVVGASQDDTARLNAGAAYVYDLNVNGGMPQATLFSSSPLLESEFGKSLAASGDRVVVGAPRESNLATPQTGGVYIYDVSGGTPILAGRLQNPTPETLDSFGSSVALDGDLLVVGATADDTVAENAGAAYVYDLSSTTPFVPIITLLNPSASSDSFGASVSISGTTLIVGAPTADSAYVFELASATPEVPTLTWNRPPGTGAGRFGQAVAISGAKVLIGMPLERDGSQRLGSAYLYDLTSDQPTTPMGTISNPNPRNFDRFGWSVDASVQFGLIGAPGNSEVYVYDLTGTGQLAPISVLSRSDANAFGYAVVGSDERVIVGAPEVLTPQNVGGFAFVYDFSTGPTTTPISILRSSHQAPGDAFGFSVALSGDQILVGEPHDDSQVYDQGAVQLFEASNRPTVDFNGDANVDCLDINALTSEIAAGTNDTEFDLDADGVVDLRDRDTWLAIAGELALGIGRSYLLGDANLDGLVDAVDYIQWKANRFTSNSDWCAGDFNANGLVDGEDLIIWNRNKFQSSNVRLRTSPPRELGLVAKKDRTPDVALDTPIRVIPPVHLELVNVQGLDSVFAAWSPRRGSGSDSQSEDGALKDAEHAIPIKSWVF